MNTQSFHFTIGPVQGFVSQARRTRDFWAGSFLLSWLAGVAMLEVKRQGGTIEFPAPEEGYLAWMQGNGENSPPRQGAIPNRFKAGVGADFKADLVAQTVREAWWQLAEWVWFNDLENVAQGGAHRAIWERQHRNFWEISWILAGEDVPNALDRRKNWRNHFQAPEPGVKCMVMEGWQELSGAERPNNQAQREFWEKVRSQRGVVGMQTDLAAGERLCAIAFVKRRFARYFELFKAEVGGLSLRGWKVPTAVPSVSYLAAVHWLEAVLLHPDPDAVDAVLKAAQRLDAGNNEWETRIACLEEARQNHDVPRSLIARDGSVFFGGVRDDASTQEKQDRAQQVRDFQSALKLLNLQEPLSPFYAILLMDGDSLGKQMGDRDKQPRIAEALKQFTQKVPGIVEENNGFLVYAGGDDVLAVLPLEDAFPCAKALRDVYWQSCQAQEITSTLSGAIEFTHVKMALGRVLADAHDLLDRVAKDGCGRDALAVRVWKPGGCDIEWAQPWSIALKGSDSQITLGRLSEELEAKDAQTPFSSGFFYKIRERFELLNPAEGAKSSLLDDTQAALLLAADYVASGVHGGGPRMALSQAQGLIEPLLEQCYPHKQQVDEAGNIRPDDPLKSSRLNPDAALLVRFLAHKGIEPRGGRG